MVKIWENKSWLKFPKCIRTLKSWQISFESSVHKAQVPSFHDIVQWAGCLPQGLQVVARNCEISLHGKPSEETLGRPVHATYNSRDMELIYVRKTIY